jgi:hypothetical protein
MASCPRRREKKALATQNRYGNGQLTIEPLATKRICSGKTTGLAVGRTKGLASGKDNRISIGEGQPEKHGCEGQVWLRRKTSRS